jgi:maltose alpha-D-glucosyltransferase/alpha-amylase
LFRRFQAGPNPDSEMERFLTEKARFDRVPPFAGEIDYEPGAPGPATLGLLEGLVENEGDAWKWTIEELERYYEACAPTAFPEEATVSEDLVTLSETPLSQLARDHVGLYLESAATLGRRTGQLHRALATPTDDPAFQSEPLTEQNLQQLLDSWREQAVDVFNVLKENVSRLPDDAVEQAALVLGRRREFLSRLRLPAAEAGQGMRIRIHGDYHLGQILRVKTDFMILDFEGEPSRPLAERRAKQSPLKDVAGMLRSFSYAAYATLMNWSARRGEDAARLEPWARLWERSAAAEFLRGYREATAGADFLPADPVVFRRMLGGFRLSKALYEVLYELNNRPAWVRVPLMGILSFSA